MIAVIRTYLIRALAFVAGSVAAHLIINALPDDGGGANIGAGLIVFALIVLVAFLWGFVDGRRIPIGILAGVWLAVGATLGLADPFLIAMSDGELDWSVVRSDLVTFVPFDLVLVGVPAIIGGALGLAAGSATRDHTA
jgi:hypothetical protein